MRCLIGRQLYYLKPGMLTPEERRGIEEQERKWIAKEKYRAEVREKLQEKPARKFNWVLTTIGIAVAVIIIGVITLFYIKGPLNH